MKTLGASPPIFLCLFLLLAGCKGKPQDQIINTWKIVEIHGEYMDSVKQRIIDHTVLEFTKDGRYIMSGSRDDNGTYRLDSAGTKITIISKLSGGRETTDIDTINNHRLVFRDERGTRFVMEPK